ncbi:glycosyl transferase group 1 [Paramagnetospirillum magnetotacticum MS-1]|uniref:Glycosyl transferase group 1 n=1 Tax=Paramagnetospirillum magnetotacticum MS-1 TaxID=272627 RepID=A0A0C2U7M3_PARME|nr:glycosyltransferase [Paramagnetospirillum magnetotacticum]KIL97472.1 glycosyl transferase group 1 [Paramagnetospirillum magnetotacticum MS-1]
MSGLPILSVAALVDLEQRQGAGGHVKCWERLAEAALRQPESLELTVFMSGEAERTTELGANVRCVTLPPVFSTRRLQALTGPLPDHTDLSPWHPLLARRLSEGRFNMLHTTDAFFAFSRTAERVAARTGLPLVNSIHTATPELTRLFAEQSIHKICGHGWLGRLLTQDLDLPERFKRTKLARLARHQSRCAYALVSKADEVRLASEVLPPDRVRMLRRGLNHNVFAPEKRDRAWLSARFGIPETMSVALFVGRLDPSKNLAPLVEAIRQVNGRGVGLHLFCAGDGREKAAILGRLGSSVTCPGQLGEEDLSRVYACADLLVMPSEIEVVSNVVLEGLASGLPVVVSAAGGMSHYVQPGLTGEVVGDSSARKWAEVLEALAGNPGHLAEMRQAVTSSTSHALPSWDQVLVEDLLPVWRAAVEEAEAVAMGQKLEAACRS